MPKPWHTATVALPDRVFLDEAALAVFGGGIGLRAHRNAVAVAVTEQVLDHLLDRLAQGPYAARPAGPPVDLDVRREPVSTHPTGGETPG